MSSKKFIYKKCNEESDELETVSPCFQISSEVQLRDVPTNGEEYLLKVMSERKKIASISKCNKDYSQFARNQSRFIKENPKPIVSEKLIPTIEWQNIQVADFSDVRMYISRLLAKKSSWMQKVKKIELVDNSMVAWKIFLSENDPTLTCVLGLQHALLDRGLEALTDIISRTPPGKTIEHKTGQWVYAFLACTSLPLLSDTTSILRNLARKCADIRSQINPESDGAVALATPLNIFICLVARYFRQYDLADTNTED